MQVHVLGPVTLEADGTVVPLGGRKQRAVFALLALNADSVVSLDRLVHEIWLEQPPARATLALQAYVSRLRRLLAGPGGGTAGIESRVPGWVLRTDPETVDAVRFRRLVVEGRTCLAGGDPARAGRHLRAGLSLWHGRPLEDLHSQGMDELAREDVVRLEEERLEACELLFDAELGAASYASVATQARGFVSEHPFRERSWVALATALYFSGRQADALDTLRELRGLLAAELGLDPSPEVVDLEARILRHDVRPPSPLPTRAAAVRDPGPERSQEALVGRRAELDAIAASVRAAGAGDGRLVVIEGTAGVGKSTLLRRLEAAVSDAGGLGVRGSGTSAGATPSLWPWVTVMRGIVQALPDVVDELPERSRTVLAGLDPMVGGAPATTTDPPPGAATATNAGLARTRLFRAVVDLLVAARSRTLLAVVIDDAQWLDDETLDLLAVATEELVAAGVLVALGVRDEAAGDADVGFRLALDRLALRAGEAHVRLRPAGLDASEVAALMRDLTGHDQPADLVQAVTERTGGNPFFVGELVRLSLSERRLDAAGVRDLLPSRVRDVIRRRLSRLPARTTQVLCVTALVGTPVGAGLLARVTNQDELEVIEACEAAVAAEVLVEDPTTGRFELSHDLVRHTVAQSMSGPRRSQLQARIATALASVPRTSSEHLVALAHHMAAAVDVLGPDTVVPHVLAALDDALTRWSSADVEAFLASARDLARTLPAAAQRESVGRQIAARASIARLVMQSRADLPQYSPGEATLEPLDPAEPTLWWISAVLLTAAGRHRAVLAAALAEVERVRALDPLPAAALALAEFVVGLACFELGDHDRAIGSFARTEELERDLVEPPTLPMRGIATALSAAVETVRGRDGEAIRLLTAAASLTDVSPSQSGTITFWTAWCAAQRGDHRAAALSARRYLTADDEAAETFYGPGCEVIVGWASALDGAVEGVASCAAAYERCAAGGGRFQLVTYLLLWAEAATHHRQVAEARRLVGQAQAVAAETGEATCGPRLRALVDAWLDPAP